MSLFDIVAFGAHSDDIEIGMGGVIKSYTDAGMRVLLCDVTKAELSSNGTVERRLNEANVAASILGAERKNLGFPDRGLKNNKEALVAIIDVIREVKPTIIFAPYPLDRHPDHGDVSDLVKEAYFSAGIRKYETSVKDAYRPEALYLYMINGYHKPDFYINISENIESKIKSLQAYESQFVLDENGVSTPLTDGYIERIVARDRLFGSETQVEYAEGFFSVTPMSREIYELGRRWRK